MTELIVKAQAARIIKLQQEQISSEAAMIELWEFIMGDLELAPMEHKLMAEQMIKKLKDEHLTLYRRD